MKEYLLSICIPTYNRGYALEKALDQIVGNKAFDDEVEIVISDNCSTDNTEEIASRYAEQYPNIRYFRNEKNVIDENFWLAINRATGKYRKLQGDYYSFTENGLEHIKNTIREHLEDRTCLYFTNHYLYTESFEHEKVCADADEYLYYVATMVTSINIFGIWDTDIPMLEDPLRVADKKLLQVDWTMQLLTKKQGCILVNDIDCQMAYQDEIPREDRYDWFEVHVRNYYDILYMYRAKNGVENGLSEEALNRDKENCMSHFCKLYFRTHILPKKDYEYNKATMEKTLKEYCGMTRRYRLYRTALPFSYAIYPYWALRYKDNPVKKLLKTVLKR